MPIRNPEGELNAALLASLRESDKRLSENLTELDDHIYEEIRGLKAAILELEELLTPLRNNRQQDADQQSLETLKVKYEVLYQLWVGDVDQNPLSARFRERANVALRDAAVILAPKDMIKE